MREARKNSGSWWWKSPRLALAPLGVVRLELGERFLARRIVGPACCGVERPSSSTNPEIDTAAARSASRSDPG